MQLSSHVSTVHKGSEEGEMCGQLPVPAPASCPGASPSMLQKNHIHSFTALSTV